MKKLKNEELNRLTVEEYKVLQKTPIIIVLDDVRSLNNVGSAFRTSDAFALEKIYLCGITGIPPHREINKTALGATETVDWEYNEDVIELTNSLKRSGYKIIAVEQADESCFLDNFMPDNSKMALIFGNEVTGVKDGIIELADEVVEIRQYGTKHSLNISVSIGIVVWDILAKRKIKKD